MSENDFSFDDSVAELEDAIACGIVAADKAQSLAEPFGVELNVAEMYRLSHAVPCFHGERQRGMSIAAIVENIVRERGLRSRLRSR